MFLGQAGGDLIPPGCFLHARRRLDYVNHARRLAEDDWAGVESEDEDKDKDKEGEDAEEEAMDVDAGRKLPKRYANQVRSHPGGRAVAWFEATTMAIWGLRGVCPARLGAHRETVLSSPPKHAEFKWKTGGDGIPVCFRIT